jgi:hypothetical protein
MVVIVFLHLLLLHYQHHQATAASSSTSSISIISTTSLFKPSSRYPCFRQPVLVSANNQILLAFAENRNVTLCAPALQHNSNEVGSLQLKRSLDNGKTWSNHMQELYVGNIDFYTCVQDRNTSTTWLFLQNSENVIVLKSYDSGVTWSTPFILDIDKISGRPFNFSSIIKPTVGHGIQIHGTKNDQRLILPFVCTNETASSGSSGGDKGQCPECQSCLLISDDHGKTFFFGAIGQPGSRESSIVQTRMRNETNEEIKLAATLYSSERNFGPLPGVRMYGVSKNGGITFDQKGLEKSLITPTTPHWTGIVGAVSRLNMNQIVYVGSSSPHKRKNVKIYVSGDEGETWNNGTTIWPGPAGYCDVASINDNLLAVLFESGKETFADEITFSRISFL